MPHLRRRPKNLIPNERIVYNCELEACPNCGQPLRPCRHYTFCKTVQHLDRVSYVASRPKECPNQACPEVGRCYPSACAQTVALPKSTYGLDVVAQIGWWRDREHLSGTEIYERLRSQVQISRRHVDLLTQRYRVLMACAQRPDQGRLSQAAKEHGGLIISLDGLEPEGAQEQLWVVREVLSGSILAVGWLPRVNQDTLGALLAPVKALLTEANLPVLATLSDKQGPLVAALKQTWPDVPHQWCQAHYLRNAAKPLQEHDQALKTDLRRDIRKGIRSSLSQLAAQAQEGAFSPSSG